MSNYKMLMLVPFIFAFVGCPSSNVLHESELKPTGDGSSLSEHDQEASQPPHRDLTEVTPNLSENETRLETTEAFEGASPDQVAREIAFKSLVEREIYERLGWEEVEITRVWEVEGEWIATVWPVPATVGSGHVFRLSRDGEIRLIVGR